MKKIDCFKFFNELELLHLRFMEYYDHVDYFVLVEATKTHTGKPKELIFEKNKEKFSKYLNKVIHIVVDDLPDYSVNDIWKAENYQRNCISRGLEKIISPGDKYFISDCDEFWDVDVANKYINLPIMTFNQELFYYYVNCKQNCMWHGSIMFTHGAGNVSPQDLRNMARSGGYNSINGGWHYSYMGGANRIREKVENIAESHYIIDKIGNETEIEQKMNSATDLWNREEAYAQKRFVELTYTPKKLKEFLSIYPDFIKV